MHIVIAQATEAGDAVKGLGEQLPALGIGVLAKGGLGGYSGEGGLATKQRLLALENALPRNTGAA